MNCMWLIFKTEILIYQFNANLDEKILFGKITRLVDPEMRKMLERGFYGHEDSTNHSGP